LYIPRIESTIILALLYEPIPTLDPYTYLIYTRNQLDSLYTSKRNIIGTSQPISLNNSPNPTPYNLFTDSILGPRPATTITSSTRTGI
jgi:hypothetical protein